MLQVGSPRLLKIRTHRGKEAWWGEFLRFSRAAAVVAFAICVAEYFTLLAALPHLGRSEVSANVSIFPLLLCATLCRVISDLGNVALYCLRLDKSFAFSNIVALVIGTFASIVGMRLNGLTGLAWAGLLSSFVFAGARALIVCRAVASTAR
jgi:hypothetical protein